MSKIADDGIYTIDKVVLDENFIHIRCSCSKEHMFLKENFLSMMDVK